MSALGRRVALMRKIKEFHEWRALRSEYTEHQSALSRGWMADLKSKVEALICEPIPLKQDDFYQSIVGGAKFADRSGHLERHPPISDRVICDEIQSASKLKDQLYRNIFELEIDKLVGRGPNQQVPLFGIQSPIGQEEARKEKAQNSLTEYYEIWRADIQMPSFAGDFGLKVNLFYDDKQLCKAFSDWLKETRKQAEFPIAKRMFVTLKKFQEWHGMRVLPYMDLWLYQLAFDVDFDEIHFARLLFRSEDDPEASGDKEYKNWLRNTRKCAESLIQQSVFLSLRYKTTPSRSDQ